MHIDSSSTVLVLVGHYFVWHIRVLLIQSAGSRGSIVNIRKRTCVHCLSSNTPRPGSLHLPFLQSLTPCIECPIQVRFSHRTWLPALLRKSRLTPCLCRRLCPAACSHFGPRIQSW